MSDVVEELRAQKLFRGLDTNEIERIAPTLTVRQVPRDEHVFWENSPCEGIFLVRKGKIEVAKATADGWNQPLVHLSTGQFLGEIALLDGSNHATEARAVESTEVFLLPKESFEVLEREAPEIMLKIIKNIAIIGGLNVRRMNEKFLKVLINY